MRVQLKTCSSRMYSNLKELDVFVRESLSYILEALADGRQAVDIGISLVLFPTARLQCGSQVFVV